MRIVADENIPLIAHYFGHSGELILKPGRQITREDLIDADILLVRSVTQVNQDLLNNTNIQFVGSATTGFDHIDTRWLDQAGIRWTVAKGCNATAVVEYVIAVIAALQNQDRLLQPNLRAGVIGAGNIGAAVAEKLKLLGFEVLLCDPPRAETDHFNSTSLHDFVELDFITLHTPLTFSGAHPTYHLIEKEFLQRQKPGCILLNTGRGAAINFADLKKHGKHLSWCLDVWENEPLIDPDILTASVIATPHIAGYSVQSKYRGTQMIYDAALQQKMIKDKPVLPIPFPTQVISFANRPIHWRDVILQIYNPLDTSKQMKDILLHQPNAFDQLRKNFIERHEFEFVELHDAPLKADDLELLDALSHKQVSSKRHQNP